MITVRGPADVRTRRDAKTVRGGMAVMRTGREWTGICEDRCEDWKMTSRFRDWDGSYKHEDWESRASSCEN